MDVNPFRKSRRFDSPNLISVPDFIKETKEDFKSPTTSNFTKIIPECHETVAKLSEVIDTNRENFRTVKRSLKEIAKANTALGKTDEDLWKIFDRIAQENSKGTLSTKNFVLLISHFTKNLRGISGF